MMCEGYLGESERRLGIAVGDRHCMLNRLVGSNINICKGCHERLEEGDYFRLGLLRVLNCFILGKGGGALEETSCDILSAALIGTASSSEP